MGTGERPSPTYTPSLAMTGCTSLPSGGSQDDVVPNWPYWSQWSCFCPLGGPYEWGWSEIHRWRDLVSNIAFEITKITMRWVELYSRDHAGSTPLSIWVWLWLSSYRTLTLTSGPFVAIPLSLQILPLLRREASTPSSHHAHLDSGLVPVHVWYSAN